MKNLAEWIAAFKQLDDLLQKYLILAARLSTCDLELVEEADAVIAEREQLVADIKLVNDSLARYIQEEDAETAAIIRKMLHGETVTAVLDQALLSLQSKILNIRSLQSEIQAKDEANIKRWQNKHNEIKRELSSLQDDRKKRDFYASNTAVTGSIGKGNTFNSQV